MYSIHVHVVGLEQKMLKMDTYQSKHGVQKILRCTQDLQNGKENVLFLLVIAYFSNSGLFEYTSINIENLLKK